MPTLQPVLLQAASPAPPQPNPSSSTLADLGLSRATFGCEGEDAQLTGMTRSPLRRRLGLGDSLRHAPKSERLDAILNTQRIA